MSKTDLNMFDLKELRKLIRETIEEVEGQDPELIDPEGGEVFHIDDDGNIIPGIRNQDS
jgi:hypothetical protein